MAKLTMKLKGMVQVPFFWHGWGSN